MPLYLSVIHVWNKKNRVVPFQTSQQKSQQNHAIQLVEAPGVECAVNHCKTNENPPNPRQIDVTPSGQNRSNTTSWDEFVTAVTRANVQIGKARKALEADDKALADDILAKVERRLERLAKTMQKGSR
ncbi:MAG: hypothetical protein ACKO6N_05555 [Myxococcota bacterium]